MNTVVVLRMHRSGTSLVAKILHTIGISMGQEFLDADDANLGGYWEDIDFLWINKGILEASGGSWRSIPKHDKLEYCAKKFKNIVTKTIAKKNKLANGNSWGWKDPRTCLTISLYHEQLTNPKYIHVIRNKSDICSSLQRVHSEGSWSELAQDYEECIQAFAKYYNFDILDVHFEDLLRVGTTHSTIKSIISFTNGDISQINTAKRAINPSKLFHTV